MSEYKPPFTISIEMLNLVSDISNKLGKISVFESSEAKPYLRKNNRIHSVHSSLAIEANSLSIDDVKAVIDGKKVTGPKNEIDEVLDAYKAYEMLGLFNPYKISELLRLHKVMTENTVKESGKFRKGEEGVFEGDKCIFMAPPASMVDGLMNNLFLWLNEEKEKINPLILSCIFHYEFVFIHPFSDGNGRMARLWHTAILSEWNEIFKYIPVESKIYLFQKEYYNAISKCHINGNSDVFIEFMLTKINEALDSLIENTILPVSDEDVYITKLLSVMEKGYLYSANDILKLLGLKSKETLRKHYIDPAIEKNLIRRTIPDKPTSRNQKYILSEVKNDR